MAGGAERHRLGNSSIGLVNGLEELELEQSRVGLEDPCGIRQRANRGGFRPCLFQDDERLLPRGEGFGEDLAKVATDDDVFHVNGIEREAETLSNRPDLSDKSRRKIRLPIHDCVEFQAANHIAQRNLDCVVEQLERISRHFDEGHRTNDPVLDDRIDLDASLVGGEELLPGDLKIDATAIEAFHLMTGADDPMPASSKRAYELTMLIEQGCFMLLDDDGGHPSLPSDACHAGDHEDGDKNEGKHGEIVG